MTPYYEANLRGNRRPETPIEALMMAASGENIVESVVELQPLREAIAECIEQLGDQDRFIIDAINSEMISLEELGGRLGVSKPHAWRLRNAAYERLRLHLLENQIIRERLGLEDEADNGGF
jgi:DNA-directed RNA polymerase specialized sigma subunit